MVPIRRTILRHGKSMNMLKQELKKLSLFSLSGMINTLVGYGVIFSLMLMGAGPILSNSIGYAIGFFLSFFMGKYVIFRSLERNRLVELMKYFIVFLAAFLMNFLTLHLSLKVHLSPYLCQLLGGAVFSAVNYLFSRIWVFRSPLR